MKKLISVLVIISISIALFALDLNIGVDPVHNFDATATVSAHFGRIEVGGGVYTNAVGNFLAYTADGTTAALKDKLSTSFQTAEYGGLSHVYYDLIDSEFMLAVGGIAEVGSIMDIKASVDSKRVSLNLLASAKGTYLLKDTIGLFAQAGLPVATLNISGSAKQFESPIKGSGEEIYKYVKDNARFQVGVVLSI